MRGTSGSGGRAGLAAAASAAVAASVGSSLGLSACGGGGGGGAPAAPVLAVQFAEAAATAGEDGGAHAVQVELLLSHGPLAEPVTVLVQDAGAGSAALGADYAPTGATLTFPAGSAHGAVQSVPVTPFADLLVEGPETVVLALADPDGAALGAHATHTLELADGDAATLAFSAGASATSDESDGPQTLTVVLALDPGTTLAVPLAADVVDTGDGTATSGADYVALAGAGVLFPAGAPDGDARTVEVLVLDDLATEGSESVVARLANASAAATLGAADAHVLVITDDDGTLAPFLHVEAGPSGATLPVPHLATLDFGAAPVGGTGATLEVRVSNLGADPLPISAPTLSGPHANDFGLELDVVVGPALAGTDPEPLDAPAPFAAADADLAAPGALAVDGPLLAALGERRSAVLRGFPLPGGGAVDLALERLPLPFTRDAVVHVGGRATALDPRALVGDLTLWRGTVVGAPGSRAFLALSSQGSRGFVRLGGGAGDTLHLLADAPLPGAGPATARLAWESALGPGAEPLVPLCDGARLVPGALAPTLGAAPGGGGGALPAGSPATGALGFADCRLALETDHQLYLRFGSLAGTASYVTELVAAVADTYEQQVQTTLAIAYLGLHDTPADPWTTPDGPGTASQMLDEFRAAWLGNWPAAADLAHFLSGASLGGGIAYIDVLCSQAFGFGVSGNLNGSIHWGSFSGDPGPLNWDFVVLAHELGHNFGALHTQDYCPPLDTCQPSCAGAASCEPGTLMSYCHLCPGGVANLALEFHPQVAEALREQVNTSCLGQSSLAGGETVVYRATFAPLGAGARSATLSLPHGAANQPTPFRLHLAGTGAP